MTTRAMLTRALPILALAVAAAFLAPAAASGGDRAKVKEYEVDAHWIPLDVDFKPDSKRQFDKFTSRGKPFGDGIVVTNFPRKSDDRIRGEFKGKDKHGVYKGILRLDRTIIETTPTKQVAVYDGRVLFDLGTKRYEPIIGAVDIEGTTTCRASGCTGRLNLSGKIEF